MRLMHDRMLFLLSNLTGSVVQVTVKNGIKFEGVFHGASTEGGDIGVALKHARKIHDPQAEKSKANTFPVKPSMLIMGKDVVEIFSPDTDLTAGDDSFKTDTDISGKLDIKERELFKWNPEEGSGEFGALEGETGGQQNGNWDQFAANEKLFGLKTDFDEEMYTTRLDRSAPDFKDRERWAIEKANEIQRSAANNVHVMEERGIAVDDSGMDEEDRYAGVVRDTSKYMPPALRKQIQPNGAGRKDDKKTADSTSGTSPLQSSMTANIPKSAVTAASPVTNLPNARQDDKKSTPSATATAAATKIGPDEPPKRIENEIASTFRKFAIQEKDKLNAKKQALQKKEKEDRLAELMKFHQTFKLNVPVPADLVPLLSKGKKSGSDSLSPPSISAELAQPVEKDAEEKKSTFETPASQASLTATGPTTTKDKLQTQEGSSSSNKPIATPSLSPPKKESVDKNKSPFRFNVKATEFKPNPSAPVFVPGGGGSSASTAKSSPGEGSPFFAGRQLKKGTVGEQLTIAEAFTSPFAKGKEPVTPNSIGPTWPFGSKQYKYHFNQYTNYEEEMFGGYGSPGYPYGYPQYRYAPQYVQAPMAMQQTGHPYMSPQQFVHNVPLTGAPMPHAGAPPAVAYSPQMANVSPHGSPFPQGFPSPQRSPIVPHGVPPHQVYQYQGNGPHGPGPVIMQRPIMMDPNQVHYPPQQEQHQLPHPQHHGPLPII
ncbi:LsmAD domain-containing protein [Circinella umbellata]|nr:LsmAD domain-containing protein [Circinella umbellata]